jgi:hypothetical protein
LHLFINILPSIGMLQEIINQNSLIASMKCL